MILGACYRKDLNLQYDVDLSSAPLHIRSVIFSDCEQAIFYHNNCLIQIKWEEVFCLIMYLLLTDIGEYVQHRVPASSDSSSKIHILHKQTDFSSRTICILRTWVLGYPSGTRA